MSNSGYFIPHLRGYFVSHSLVALFALAFSNAAGQDAEEGEGTVGSGGGSGSGDDGPCGDVGILLTSEDGTLEFCLCKRGHDKIVSLDDLHWCRKYI